MLTLREEVLLRQGLSSKSLTIGELKSFAKRLPIGLDLIYDGDAKIFRLRDGTNKTNGTENPEKKT